MGAPAAVPPGKNNVPHGPLNAAERQELVELQRKLGQVKDGKGHIDKGYGLVCRQKGVGVHDVYRLVKANQADLPRLFTKILFTSTVIKIFFQGDQALEL